MRIDFSKVSAEQSAGPFIREVVEGIKKPKLFICSLSFNGEFCVEFVMSLTKTLRDLWEKGIENEIHYAVNDHFIDRARNLLVEQFLNSDCTHILMIDADQGWDATKVYEMLMLNEPIISGAVPIKDPEEENYLLQIKTDLNRYPLLDDKGLIYVNRIGGAFLMIKRDVFIKLRAFRPYRTCPSISPNYYWYFQVEEEAGVLWGEDMTFCKRCNDAGIPIKMMQNVDMVHVGKKVWTGNYHNYLMRQPKTINENQVRV